MMFGPMTAVRTAAFPMFLTALAGALPVVAAPERGAADRDHETRIQALEARLAAAESRADNRFNPAVSLVLQGGWAAFDQPAESVEWPGLPLGGEAGPHPEGLALWESELTASANIDHLFFGQATLGFHEHDGETETDVEEAFIETLALPAGLGVRMGRFYSDLGYLNGRHSHAWDFADAPMVYQALLGGQYGDDGLRATWLAPVSSVLMEVGAELFRGGAYPAGGLDGDVGAVWLGFVRLGGDLGVLHSWQLSVSHGEIDVDARAAGGHDDHDHAGPVFSGDATLSAVSAVWKTQLSKGRSWILQAEYLYRDENGFVDLVEDSGAAQFGYDGEQDGGYIQTLYQFRPRWRAGFRYDWVGADNQLVALSNTTGEADDDVAEETGLVSAGDDPSRWALMLDWSPSEFSRLRLQYAQAEVDDRSDDQVHLQYIVTLGAHGAHRF